MEVRQAGCDIVDRGIEQIAKPANVSPASDSASVVSRTS